MPEFYSHSKLETFEQCKLKFKYRYIDKIIPEIEKSIEAHLGDIIHRTFEWLYQSVMKKVIPSIDEVISFYSEEWEANYSEGIRIINKSLTTKDYFNRGVQFLINYYMKHQPFNDNTIATEEKIEINLDENGEIRLIGYIDRLVHNIEANEIEVHDYKTSSSLFAKEKLENSRQLALYSLAIKEVFGEDKKVSMILHFLAHDSKSYITKTNEELQKLKYEVRELINKIKNTKDFSPNKSPLCNWCEYKSICPAWGNSPKIKEYRKRFERQKKIGDFFGKN